MCLPIFQIILTGKKGCEVEVEMLTLIIEVGEQLVLPASSEALIGNKSLPSTLLVLTTLPAFSLVLLDHKAPEVVHDHTNGQPREDGFGESMSQF